MKICNSCNFENSDEVDFCDVCHAHLVNSAESLETDQLDPASKLSGDCIGQVLGMRYIITAEPVCDGMGRTFQGEDAADESDVLIHEIDAAFGGDEKALCRIRSAARLLADVTHDNILCPADFILDEPFKFFITRQTGCTTLSAKLQEGPLSVSEVLEVFTQVGAGLDYAHTSGILHCDIVPDNILIDESGKACLANFGISRIIKDVLAGTGQIQSDYAGQFLAAEAIEGSFVRRSDIYSLAACICFSLAGNLDSGQIVPNEGISDEQKQALKKALNDNPVLRQPSALQLLKELEVDKSRLGWNTVNLCVVSISEGTGGRIVLPDAYGARYDENTEIRIEAVCDEGYHFAGWTGTAVDGGKVADSRALRTRLKIDDDYTLSANFAIDRHVLKLSATCGGGN